MFNKKNNGFTLMELLVTMGIAVVLGSVAMSNYFSYQSTVSIDGAANELLGNLRDAQQRAISQDQQSAWGVYINAVSDDNDYYELFYGNSRSTGTVVSKTVLPVDLEFLVPAQGSVSEINFAKSTGLPNHDYTLIIVSKRNSTLARTISFNMSTGLIASSENLGSGPTLSSITPNSALNSAPVNITALVGTGFQQGALLKLTKSGNPDLICTNMAFVNSALLTGTCDVTGKSGGTWNTVVVNPDGQSATLANSFTLIGVSVPGFVSSFSAVVGNQQLVLNWGAPLDNGGATITSYKVYRSTTSGAETLLTSGGCSGLGSVLTCTDSGLTNGTTYYYKISAVNSVGEGALSSEISYIPASVPTAPQNFAVSSGNQQLVLNWGAPLDNGGATITSYKVYRSTTSGAETLLTSGGCSGLGSVLTCTDSGLTNGTTYYYKISAVNSVGEGALSSESSATTFTTPTAPQNFAAISGKQKIVLNWTAPSNNGGSSITNYEIYRGASSGGETLLAEVGSVLTYTDSGLANGSTYYYKVAAKNIIGIGTQSSESSATTLTEWRRIFVTSTSYSGNLGGLSGADSLCQTRANAVSLGGTWKAWLSDETTNASDRLYHDTVAYVNMNNDKVANNWTDLTDGSLTSAIQYNESGVSTAGQAWTGSYSDGTKYFSQDCTAWTSTTGTGGDAGLSGIVTSTTGSWSYNGTNSCNTSLPLYCVEQPPFSAPDAPTINTVYAGNSRVSVLFSAPSSDGGSPITSYTVTSNPGNITANASASPIIVTGLTNGIPYTFTVTATNAIGTGPASVPSSSVTLPTVFSRLFVTSLKYNGNLGGLSGADAKCQARADAASLGGIWKAWLSDSTTDASARLFHNTVPYVDILGNLVANDWTGLTSSNLIMPIKYDEFGVEYTDQYYPNPTSLAVHTNTYANGTRIATQSVYTCSDWTYASNYDQYSMWHGFTRRSDSTWSYDPNWYGLGCPIEQFLYCFEQPTAPSAPENLLALRSSVATEVALSWTAPSNNGGLPITGYKIYRGTTSGGETLLATIGNVLTYTATGHTSGITYYYKVSAVNSVGEGSLSIEALGYPGAKRIFVTSTAYNGNLGGVAGANSICQTRANAASLGGTWKALICSSTQDARSVPTYGTNSAFVRVDGVYISANTSSPNDLFDGTIANSLNKTEFNGTLSRVLDSIETGCLTTGLRQTDSNTYMCSDWTSSSAAGPPYKNASGPLSTDETLYGYYMGGSAYGCAYTNLHIYCIEI